MATIQKPQELSLRAGSSGARADMDINSAQYRAIAQLGQTADAHSERKKRVVEEGQRLADSSAAADVGREGEIFDKELAVGIEAAGKEGGYDAQVKVFEDGIAAREARIAEQLKDASDKTREAVLAAWEDEKKSKKVDFDYARAAEKTAHDNAVILDAAAQKANNVDLPIEDAMDQADEMSLTNLERFQIQTKIRDIRHAAINERYRADAQSANTVEEIEEVQKAVAANPEIPEKDRRIINASIASRKKGMLREEDYIKRNNFLENLVGLQDSESVEALEVPDASPDATSQMQLAKSRQYASFKYREIKENKKTFDAIKNGTAKIVDIDEMNIPETGVPLSKSNLRDLLNRSRTGLPLDSEEFEKAMTRIDTVMVDHWLTGDFTKKDVEKIHKEIDIEGGKFNTTASIILVEKAIRYEMAGWQDGGMNSAWADGIEVSDSMAIVADKISRNLSSDLAAGQGAASARIGPQDALDIINAVRPVIEANASLDIAPDFYDKNIKPIYDEVLDRSVMSAIYKID